MSHDLVICGGTIVTASETYSAAIGITGESIAEIGPDLHGEREIDATGMLIMPAVIRNSRPLLILGGCGARHTAME